MRPPTRSIARSLAPTLLAVLLAGCTGAGVTMPPPDAATPTPTNAPSPSAVPSSPPPAYQLSSDPNALVLRVDTAGGLIAPGYFVTHIPEFSLYADGRVITPGAVDTVYPAQLLPNLEESRLSSTDVQKLLAAADQAGLLGPDASYQMGGVADAGTTTFQTTVAGTTHRVSAYALGIGNDPTLSQADAAARARLEAFRTSTMDLSKLLGHDVTKSSYVPTSERVFFGDPVLPEGGLAQQQLTWPLAVDPATGKPMGTGALASGLKCLALSGSDLATFLTTARTANALAVWKAPSGKYSLQVRPLLPGESGCA